MCILIIKPKGVDVPTQSEINTAFENNNDGFGMAYSSSGDDKVTIKKGALTIEKVYEMLDSVSRPKSKNMVLHFRIATEGAICPGNCHPFPLTNSNKFLQATNIECDVAVGHNGILGVLNTEELKPAKGIPARASLGYKQGERGYYVGGQFTPFKWDEEMWASYYNMYGGYATTYYKKGLALKFSDTQVFIRDFLYPVKDILLSEPILNFITEFVPGKFAIMTPNKLVRIGAFSEEGGRFYSNESYKPRITKTVHINHSITRDNTSTKSTTKTEAPPVQITSLASLGYFLKCGFCGEFFRKTELREWEDLVLCESCYKQVTSDDKSKTEENVASTNLVR